MALPASGPLSFSDINAEFNRGTSMNPYRGTDYYTSTGGPFVFPATPISFSNFYGTQVNNPINVSIAAIPNLRGRSTVPSVGGVRFYFNPDGTYTSESNISTPANPSGNWVTPTTAGIGSNYWIRFTQTASSGFPGGLQNIPSNWTSMSTTLAPAFFMLPQYGASGGSKTWTVQIAADSIGLNIVATKNTWVWIAESVN